VIADRDLEYAAWPNSQEVWVIWVVIDNVPLRAEQLNPMDDSCPRRANATVGPVLEALAQPTDRGVAHPTTVDDQLVL
jgi:hypothetical protein